VTIPKELTIPTGYEPKIGNECFIFASGCCLKVATNTAEFEEKQRENFWLLNADKKIIRDNGNGGSAIHIKKYRLSGDVSFGYDYVNREITIIKSEP